MTNEDAYLMFGLLLGFVLGALWQYGLRRRDGYEAAERLEASERRAAERLEMSERHKGDWKRLAQRLDTFVDGPSKRARLRRSP